METYRLSEFHKALNVISYTKPYDKDTKEVMSKEFVQFSKLYLCKYDNDELEASYQDIIIDEHELVLSKE